MTAKNGKPGFRGNLVQLKGALVGACDLFEHACTPKNQRWLIAGPATYAPAVLCLAYARNTLYYRPDTYVCARSDRRSQE